MGGDNFNPNIYTQGLWNEFSPAFFRMGAIANQQAEMPGFGMPTYGGYQIPDASLMMPTTNWWNSLAPEVKQGAWAPYATAANNLVEQLSARGMAGGERSGYSGALGAALGEFYSQSASPYAMSLWNMTSPAATMNWQANLGLNQTTANNNYQNAMTAWQMPWNTITNYNNLAPSGAYHPEGGGTVSSIMGGLTSILGPMAAGYGMGMGSNSGGR